MGGNDKLCKELNVPEQSGWTKEQCFSPLDLCVKCKDLEAVVQVFRQWHAFLMCARESAHTVREHRFAILT